MEAQTNKSEFIVFDFEIFKYDTLLGVMRLDSECNVIDTKFMWSLDDIKEFYSDNSSKIWIGHNCRRYDNAILTQLLRGKTSTGLWYQSKQIINGEYVPSYCPAVFYDTYVVAKKSLKLIEAVLGKKISQSQVSFDIDRRLTREERELTERYNLDDLNQCREIFRDFTHDFDTKIELILQFNLPSHLISKTGTKLAEIIFDSQRGEFDDEELLTLSNLQIENKNVIDFYTQSKFKTAEKYEFEIGGTEHVLASGGLHGAIPKCYFERALYFDVEGYYNLIMINYNLLPRSMPKKSKELYQELYYKQLKMKHDGTNPQLRVALKVPLLSVYGGMLNKWTSLYDPHRGKMVTIVGQLFLIDLLEKLSRVSTIVQSNTDGIIVVPKDGYTDSSVTQILNEWTSRTKFNTSFDVIYNVYQRDVNCYMYTKKKTVESETDIVTKGELKHYRYWNTPFARESFNLKLPPAVYHAAIENIYFKRDIVDVLKSMPVQAFALITKTQTYDAILATFSDGSTKLYDKINRVFAVKHGCELKKISTSKTSKLALYPEQCLIYNDDVTELTIDDIDIDLEYYANSARRLISSLGNDCTVCKF